jgi:uncharacterized membrane protein
MARRAGNGFWSGLAAGTAAGAGVLLALNSFGRRRHANVMRLEKSVQIGRSVDEVYRAWSALDALPGMSHIIQRIRHDGDRSHWVVTMDGKTMEWDAVVEQRIPNQAIGWKSVSGPKHTGRIHFAPIGNDTLVHIVMNYAPPGNAWTRPFVQPFEGRIKQYIEQVLRDFKSCLEENCDQGQQFGGLSSRLGPTAVSNRNAQQERATGTFGATPAVHGERTTNPLGVEPAPNPNPVDYTRPPEAKY